MRHRAPMKTKTTDDGGRRKIQMNSKAHPHHFPDLERMCHNIKADLSRPIER